ncbi:hypothetical protein [Fundicoccus culcitae]|uniref:Uncharacterized protein n=1 Tax=Fundicoccus culcitae TaxID=2969821 RepID=A0ABY5P2Z7_9LACT|nr:hypothetical protein [Fundicoccus culcitae]UUX33101.1 hypothetical protein NRE15_09290 [Fundicoccus culcitae]
MGLDMYLTKKASVDLAKDADCNEVIVFSNGEIEKHVPEDEDKTHNVELYGAYWRQANWVHHWFVENVQGGNDNCQPYEVEEKQVVELLEIVNKLLDTYYFDEKKAERLAKRLLPPVACGAIFNHMQMDGIYWSILFETQRELNRILEDKAAAIEIIDGKSHEIPLNYTYTYFAWW